MLAPWPIGDKPPRIAAIYATTRVWDNRVYIIKTGADHGWPRSVHAGGYCSETWDSKIREELAQKSSHLNAWTIKGPPIHSVSTPEQRSG